VTVRVTHPTLGSDEAAITVRNVAGSGRQEPSAQLTAAETRKRAFGGDSTEVTARLLDTGHAELDDVVLSLGAPSGWSVQATSPTRFAVVAPGQAVEATWTVTVPKGASPGDYPLVTRAAFTYEGERSGDRDEVTLSVPTPPTTLAAAFDNAGISNDDDVDSADLDGVGNSFSEQAITAAGLPPGATVVHDGITFTWPGVPAGQRDNVLADAQNIELSGTGSHVGFLGCTSRGPLTKSGLVYYEDGSTSDFTITVDDYFNPPTVNDVVATMPYINSQGIGGRVRGQRKQTVHVFYTSAPVEPGKRVVGVELPKVDDTVQGGRPAMHIFAIGLG
jgi:hypothetical protein